MVLICMSCIALLNICSVGCCVAGELAYKSLKLLLFIVYD